MITARTGTSDTATDTGTILILYGCLIPLGLSNLTPPRTEPWLGWGRQPGKKYWGFQGRPIQLKVDAEEQVVGDGRFFQPWTWSDFWKQRWRNVDEGITKLSYP